MGKKAGLKRTIEDVENKASDVEADAELEAEIAAIREINEERQLKQSSSNSNSNSKSISNNSNNGYNKDALTQFVSQMETSKLPFVETYQVCKFDLDIKDENDDLEREMEFLNHSLLSVKQGRTQLTTLGVPTRRPSDFFCEHVKTDVHMARIKDRLILEEKKIDAVEQRKQRDFNRKFNKQVFEQNKKAKTEGKDSAPKGRVNKFTTMRREDADKERAAGDGEHGGSSGANSRGHGGGDLSGKSKKRQVMDRKYGGGGKNRTTLKKNDARSLNDFKDFKPKGSPGSYQGRERGSFGGRGGGGRGAGGRGGGGRGGGGRSGGGGGGRSGGGRGAAKSFNRPGKSTRDKSRAGKK
jgi:rRNA-processing protein EBP2